MPYVKKLIEVSIPLKEINVACAKEKLPGIGAHPRGLHLWWARRPLAAARAVIFCQMVDDPSGYVAELMASPLRQRGEKELKQNAEMGGDTSQTIEEWLVETERERLHQLVREMVVWKTFSDADILKRAHAEIVSSWKRHCRREGIPEDTSPPAFHDPFAGGGAIPLEAQRLGLESYASDLNPVAVTINKAMIEIPPKFASLPPVNPEANDGKLATQTWKGAQGLAEDVRYYGNWMKEQAEKKIGHLYPPVEITKQMVKERPDLKKYEGKELTVIAWLWARTVKSPNPAYQDVEVPLVRSFEISSKKGKEVWVEPIIEDGGYHFKARSGKIPADAIKGTVKRTGGVCIMSDTPMPLAYIREEGKKGRMTEKLMAIVCEGVRERVYLSPIDAHVALANTAEPTWKPDHDLPVNPRDFKTPNYGMTKFGDLFTERQLVGLTMFSDLVTEVRRKISDDLASNPNHELHTTARISAPLAENGTSTKAYAEAVSVYLGFAVNRSADFNNTITGWRPGNEKIMNLFSRQAIPMCWDYGEANLLGNVVGGFITNLLYQSKCIEKLNDTDTRGFAVQADAAVQNISKSKIISTDPPYYDNIGYADLSDFFYTWSRRSLSPIYPELYATMTVPKAEELVATPYRHGGRKEAEEFFMDGMTQAVTQMASKGHDAYPVTIYYAFKQSEISEEGTSSTGWVTFLDAVIKSGFSITGTWPVRSEQSTRMIGSGTNALASSVVLVCRKKEESASLATRREFVQALHSEIPEALRELQQAALAPVDLPQASIGPGMGIYSRYSRVVEPDGSTLSVRSALQLINEAVDEFLSEQESEMDDWTRFAVTWFSQHGFESGPFGDAQNIATARAISVEGVVDAGIITSSAGRVAIIKPEALDGSWDPTTDNKLTVWEIVHHLIRKLAQAGEDTAAILIKQVGVSLAEDARKLAYRLYQICETNRWSTEAQSYNELVTLFPRLKERSLEVDAPERLQQDELL